MGTVIDQATITRVSWRSRHSALRIAVATALTCLDAARCRAKDLDLLINAGIYRDRNLGEPALAALIQEDVGANPEDPHPGAHGTFSYDVANGVCGPLTALQIVDGFLRSGAIDRALVVASDADPGHRLVEERFPFADAGGALLCRRTDDGSGFAQFCWANAPDRGKSLRATVTYHDRRNRLRIEACDATDDASAQLAASVARECLDRASTNLDAIDLVLAAPARTGFTDSLASDLGVPAERIAAASDDHIHTAALIAAYHDAVAARRLRPGNAVLFVAAGAGMTAGAGLYHVPS